jgi:hypothetical protein
MLIISAIPQTGNTQIPETINYQAYLTDNNTNHALDGQVNMRFSLHDLLIDGDELWFEEQLVDVENGICNVELGLITPLRPTLAFDTQYFLQVAIDKDGNGVYEPDEIMTRRPLDSVPYAFVADEANNVVNGIITEEKIADDAVTSDKIATGAVGTAEIIDDSVTSADVGFNYAGSSSKGGPATDLNCAECISPGELDFTLGDDGDWTISGNDMYSGVSGNVGIGITDPTTKLHVSGNRNGYLVMRIHNQNTSGNQSIFFGNDPNDAAMIVWGPDNTTRRSKWSFINNYNLGHFDWETKGETKMTLSHQGNLGIGTTNPERLIVKMAGPTWDDAHFALEDFDSAHKWDFSVGASNRLFIGYDEVSRMVLDTVGNAGIGTTIPTARLHVAGNTSSSLDMKIHNQNTSGSQRLYFGSGTGDAGIIVWGPNNTSYPGKWRFANNYTSGHFDWITNGNTRMTLTNDGNVGIGTTDPSERLTVKMGGHTWDDAHFALEDFNSTSTWDFTVGGENKLFIGYEKVSKMVINTSGYVGIGNLEPEHPLDVNGRIRTNVIEITGGADLSEQFNIGRTGAESKPEPGMVVSIDPESPGDLVISSSSYDRRVAGIISGAGGVKTGMLMGQKGTEANGDSPVALSGRVYCRVDALNGPIMAGDLLTTSDTQGHAMKVTDYTKAQGAIIGKAMSSLDKGKGLVLVLVTLQ